MEIKYSEYQKDIFEFIEYGYGNAVISAVAGSGKSTTIIKALDFIKPNKKVLFLAFNNSIVEELRKKITRENTDIKTLHSLGLSILKFNYKNITLDENKYRNKLLEIIKENYIEYSDEKYISNILKLCNLGRYFLVRNVSELIKISNKYNIDIIDNELLLSLKLIQWGKESIGGDLNTIDYTDMIYLPNVLNVKIFKYDFIIIDEAQDLSISQMSLFMKCLKQGGRFIGVGDKKQCQPKGTKVLMSNGFYKNIEDLTKNEEIVSYDKENDVVIEKCNINNIVRNRYSGHVIVIETDSKKTKYTPEHICVVKFSNYTDNKYALYLMEKDGFFRTGIAPLCDANNEITCVSMARKEMADRLWILNIYDNSMDAYIEEQYYSIEHSIPRITFNNENINKDYIDSYYNRLDKKKLTNNSKYVLNIFNRDYYYPIWRKEDDVKIYKNKLFEINPYNIMKDVMEVLVFDDDLNKTYNKVSNIYEELYNDYVYSMEVDKYELYISDNILTHNCINAFAGSDIESFNKLKNTPNTIDLPLSISYRCPKNIVKFAQKIVPEIMFSENAVDGIIDFKSTINDLKDGDMVICRNTTPILKLYVELLNNNIKCYIKGSDIGLNLIDLIKYIETDDIKEMLLKLNEIVVRYINLNNSECDNIDEIYETQSYNDLIEKIECLKILSKGLKTKKELISKIYDIFVDENKEGICLSTIHKSKGLEADNVYVLNRHLTPSKFAKQGWELEQEENIEYVSYTRAKKKLGFIFIS